MLLYGDSRGPAEELALGSQHQGAQGTQGGQGAQKAEGEEACGQGQ